LSDAEYPIRFCEKKKEGSGRVALDFGEKGSDDVFWALEIRLGQRLRDEFFVSSGDVAHVVACCNDLSLVGRVLDVVLDVFQFSFQVTHETPDLTRPG
jgi:hypothetical protein